VHGSDAFFNTEIAVILPKLSAAILSMSFFGTAYAGVDLNRDTSLDQWVVISGATNGAADVLGASREDIDEHRNTALGHLMRYAREHGLQVSEFDQLFERGQMEGRKLVQAHHGLVAATRDEFINGFRHDKSIDYQHIEKVLNT
jgi:hypothetical protein